MRDITLEDTIYLNFTTRSFSTGVPTVLAGSPALSVLESNNATPITSGVSLQTDRASVVGLNQATIVATAANGYEAGKSYSVYISAGTVGGVSVIGEVVGQFTIQAAAAFTRIGAPSGASIAADLLAIDNLVDGLESTIGTPAGASVSADIAAMKVDTAAILVDTGTTLDARIPAALVGGRMDSSVGAMAANTLTAAATAADFSAEVADGILDRDMATGTDSGSTTVRTIRQALRALRNKWTNAAGTYTVYKEDDTTASWSAALTTDAAAVPIITSDPGGP